MQGTTNQRIQTLRMMTRMTASPTKTPRRGLKMIRTTASKARILCSQTPRISRTSSESMRAWLIIAHSMSRETKATRIIFCIYPLFLSRFYLSKKQKSMERYRRSTVIFHKTSRPSTSMHRTASASLQPRRHASCDIRSISIGRNRTDAEKQTAVERAQATQPCHKRA